MLCRLRVLFLVTLWLAPAPSVRADLLSWRACSNLCCPTPLPSFGVRETGGLSLCISDELPDAPDAAGQGSPRAELSWLPPIICLPRGPGPGGQHPPPSAGLAVTCLKMPSPPSLPLSPSPSLPLSFLLPLPSVQPGAFISRWPVPLPGPLRRVWVLPGPGALTDSEAPFIACPRDSSSRKREGHARLERAP